jgi:malonyl-CoA/methylmalonyl-CoA synthetase
MMQMENSSIRDCFENTAFRFGRKKAVSFYRRGKKETELDYARLNDDAHGLAVLLSRMGIHNGDRVVLFVPKCLFFVTAYLALQKLGAVAVPLNPGFKKSEMEYLLNDVEASLVIADPEKEGFIKGIQPQVPILAIPCHKPYNVKDLRPPYDMKLTKIKIAPDDPAVIIYTSGTTGRPKGTVLTQNNLVHDAQKIIRAWEIVESDVVCHALPLFHVHGLCFALQTALLSGASVLLVDQFHSKTVIRLLSQKTGPWSCTVFMAVPAMYTTMMDQMKGASEDFSHLRLITSGSAPLRAKDFSRITRSFNMEPVEREGMTETGLNFSNPLKGRRKPGSVGLALPGLQVRIVDPQTSQDVTSGERGEIWLKGPGITPGYFRKPKETKASFEGGWFRTGDLARVDEDGYYYLTDRIKNIIITGGENVSAKEVEVVINLVDGVIESSVVGIAHEKWGEKVVAAVVAESEFNLTEGTIMTFCKENLQSWKCPKNILFVHEIPRNTMGKVVTDEVKALFDGLDI